MDRSGKRVGRWLEISEDTVEAHTKSILPTLGTRGSTNVVVIGPRRGFIHHKTPKDQRHDLDVISNRASIAQPRVSPSSAASKRCALSYMYSVRRPCL